MDIINQLIPVFTLILGSYFTWRITRHKSTTDLINVDKQIESSYRQQRDQLEATAKTTQQQIHAQVILAERMKWIGNLRDSLTDFLGWVPFIVASSGNEAGVSLDERRDMLISQVNTSVKIYLLLNPQEEDHVELHVLLGKAIALQRTSVASEASAPADVSEIMAKITMSAQKILKREWERVKQGK